MGFQDRRFQALSKAPLDVVLEFESEYVRIFYPYCGLEDYKMRELISVILIEMNCLTRRSIKARTFKSPFSNPLCS